MIILMIADTQYYNIKSGNLNLSMDTICNSFDLQISDRWAGEVLPPIQPFDKCQIFINDQKIIDGYIGQFKPRITGNENTITVSGRDSSGDLVDCCVIHKTNEWLGLTLDRIVTEICKPFGIKVSVNTDVGAPIAQFRLEQSMTAFEAITKLCSLRGVLAISDGNDGVLITRASDNFAPDILQEGINIDLANAVYDASTRFSQYIVKGQAQSDDESAFGGGAAFSGVGKVTDANVPRYRPTILVESAPVNNGTCQTVAKWMLAQHVGKSQTFTVTVKGYFKLDGNVWKINELVHLSSKHMQVEDDLLISQVQFQLTDKGEFTQLTLVPKGAYVVIPDLELEKPKGGGTENAFPPGGA